MVLKILSRHSPGYANLIDYIIKESKAKDGKPHVITRNLRGNEGQAGWARQYMENEAYRVRHRSDQIYLTHEILSFSNLDKDKITRDMLNDITQKYMELRNGNGIFLSAAHFDKSHVHIHFAISALEFRTGKSMRLSKEKLHSLKNDLQEWHKQKYPNELSNSLVEHGKGCGYVTDKEWQYKNRTSRSLLKEEIGSEVKACFEKATTQKEFLDNLRHAGLHHYERGNGNLPQGIITPDNIKIRFSRLDISKEQLLQLPIDYSEEEKTLKEIQLLRKKQIDIEKSIDR